MTHRAQSSPLPANTDAAQKLAIAMLAEGYDVELIVTGESMAPFIRSDDELTITPFRGTALSLGTVLATLQGNKLVIHRLVSGKHGLVTRGDALTRSDEPLDPSAVIGIVSTLRRNGRLRTLGFGPERRALAVASRRGLLRPLGALWTALGKRLFRP